MTQPRCIEAGATYLLTRRTTRRHMLFRPDEQMNRIFIYALGCAARRTGIEIHAFCMMSTHLHLVVTDPRGVLPTFLQWFHRVLAMMTKAHRRWDGNVWDTRKASVVRLETPDAIVQKIAYTISNPVTAGLVETHGDWPGAASNVDDLGGGLLDADRPAVWLDARRDGWPPRASIRLGIPTAFADDVAAYRRTVRAVVDANERSARCSLRAAGRRAIGARRIRREHPLARVRTPERRRGIEPRFATGSGHSAARREAVARLREFRQSYARALAAWRGGRRDVRFPPGTWAMFVFHGVPVHAPNANAGPEVGSGDFGTHASAPTSSGP